MGHQFQILLLGVPELTWQDQPFTLSRRQARALLYCLADELQPVPRDRLIFLLWPDTADATARRNLTRLLSYLRNALPHPDLLLITKTAVALNLDLVQADTVQFAKSCAADEATGWETTVSLYRSRFLDGFTLPDSAEFDQWLSHAQRQYERTYLDVLRKLIIAKANSHDRTAAIHYAQQYLASDDLAEEIHRHLIGLYVANGDRSAALRQYEQCAIILERELGVSPLPETRAVYEAARDGTPTRLPAVMPKPEWTTLPGLDLPLIGRDEAWQALTEAYYRYQSGGVIFISGEAGVGKSRLMQEFAIAQSGLVLTGNSHATGQALPYQPLVQALRQALPLRERWIHTLPLWLAEVSRLLPELRIRFSDLPPPVEIAPQQAQAHLFEALTQVFGSLATDSPLLLCLDDVHWADEATIGWLEYMTQRLAGSNVCIVSTYHSHRAGRLADWRRALNRAGLAAPILLGGLSESHNLPTQTTSFIGRERELADIQRLLLNEPGCQLLTLIGPGGIGKTRLALAVAGETLDAFPDGTYFVSLASVGEVADMVPAIAEAMRFTFYGSTEPKTQLLDYLSQKQLLLMVDNLEHLQAGADLLSDILSQAPAVTLLVTSRERLHLQEEWGYEVRGLAFPDLEDGGLNEPISNLQNYSAVELFTQRARQAEASFVPSTQEMADISRICQLVEGMPLGLELAAPWIRTLSCQEIAAEIKHSLDILTMSLQNVPERHHNLRMVFEQTWRRLSEAEQTVLKQLSVFRGGCTREAAEQVTGATLLVLASLVDKALLRRTNTGRYMLHELLRQFAQEKLTAVPDEHEQTLNRHCRYYADLVYRYELEGKKEGRRIGQNLSKMGNDIQNITAAWQWARDEAELDEIKKFTFMLGAFYDIRGLVQDIEKTFGQAIKRMRSQERVDPIMYVRLLTVYSYSLVTFSRFEEARALLEEALEHCLVLDDSHGADIGLTHIFLGVTMNSQGHFEAGQGSLWRGLETSKRANFHMGVWMATEFLAAFEHQAGNIEQARQYYTTALKYAQEHQFLYGQAYSLAHLGNVYAALGDASQARDYLQQALDVNRDFLSVPSIFVTIIGIATLFYLRGRYETTLELAAIVLTHPQCVIACQLQAEVLLNQLQPHLAEDDINTVMDKAKRGRLSNRYLEPDFTIDAVLVDRLLALIDEAV